MADDPCSRYQPFVKTDSGLTPQTPYRFVATSMAYAEWLDEANRWTNLLGENAAQLENELTEDSPATTDWAARQNALADRIDELLPSFLFVPAFGASTIAKARDIAVDAACALGELEAENEELGIGATLSIPYKGQKPPQTTGEAIGEAASGFGKGLLILAVLWILARDRR